MTDEATRTTPVRILDIERMDGGVIIGFDNGKSAVFSADLLYSIFSQAEFVPDEEEESAQAKFRS